MLSKIAIGLVCGLALVLPGQGKKKATRKAPARRSA